MQTIAAIDIGSNAIRLLIGQVDSYGDIRVVKKIREPVRLGGDVFSTGEISQKMKEKAILTFMKFTLLMKEHGVISHRAVATSALREARNRDSFITDVKRVTGIAIEVIDGIKEGQLIYSAVAHRLHMTDQVALLIDIGGGSVEISVADHGVLKGSQTFKLGTVRLLQMLAEKKLSEKDLANVIRENLAPVRTFLDKTLQGMHIDFAVGTGGNIECFGKLRVAALKRNSIYSITRKELHDLVRILEGMSIKERMEELRLRPDRADVVVPAAEVIQAILDMSEVELMKIPYVGLRDGILADISTQFSSFASVGHHF